MFDVLAPGIGPNQLGTQQKTAQPDRSSDTVADKLRTRQEPGASYAEHQPRAPHALGRAQTRATADRTAQQRRFLSVPLTARGWQLLIDRSPARSGRAPAFAVGSTGVYALVFTDAVPDRAELRAIRKHAEESFAGLLFERSQFVAHMLEIALLMPRAVATRRTTRFSRSTNPRCAAP
ncbi:hypothetical protein AB0H49_24690 [Nocardia sp. NPDC050713]|uniref:hypothetical protein n=1 Tax=Nocardia sp. NPDC050713 TaxID=3154511 RepID=UPI0033CB2830